MSDPRPLLSGSPKPVRKRKPRVLAWLAYDADPWRIRLWRELLHLTREEVNQRMGIQRGNLWLYHVERYARPISKERLTRLAYELEIPVSELVSDDAARAENRAEFDAWVADGRPDLRGWFGLKGQK